MILNHRNILLHFAILILLFIVSQSSASCLRSCGNTTINHVPFPFGFSENCEIHLTCTNNGEIFIGGFQVQNLTPDGILVKIPANCNRSIKSLVPLHNRNYALTLQNGLLLSNCNSTSHGCMIPTTLLETHFASHSCSSKGDNVSCFSSDSKDKGFMNLTNVIQSPCDSLFSSIFIDGSKKGSTVSVELQTVQLGWWLEGSCNGDKCSSHANCTDVKSPFNGRSGHRCWCKNGYEGDGFLSGQGCRKASSNCNPSKYLSGRCGGRNRVGVLIGASSNCNPSKYLSGRCGGRNRVGVLIGGIIAGAALMVVLVFICYLIRRKPTSSFSGKNTKQLLSEATGSCSVPFYTFKEIEKATSGFSEKQRLGTGAYGTVYAGKLHNDEWVAIKKIRHRDTDSIEQVMNEIKLLSSVSHPNLVRLLGCCIEKGEQILVYEFMPNGTLSEHLQRERGTALPWMIRLTIAAETAQAITHLHSARNPPIYHRDIKSSNILLDDNFKSKVADFGLSRLGMTESSHISTAPQGTPGYVDPQYHQNFHLSDKSDVYSFGVVLIEIITALKVVDFSRPLSEVNLAALAIEKIGKGCVDEIIDPYLDPHRDAWTLSSLHKVAELAFRCLAFHRDMRPSMIEVAAELEYIRHSGYAPSEDNLCMAASTCSSPSNVSEKSQGSTIKKVMVESRRLFVPQRSICMIPIEEVKDGSPNSVHDTWFSEQSSPSTNSLLDNVFN